MAMLSVTPVQPIEDGKADFDEDPNKPPQDAPTEPPPGIDLAAEYRVNLTRPPDRENELIKVAALHGPPGILAVLRNRREYAWFVALGFRAIEVCLAPRGALSLPVLAQCDPVAFAMQMLEMEMMDEIFLLMKEFNHLKELQRAGLAILELLVMDDTEWRDEVARKGGVALLCEIAKQRKDCPPVLCPVMTCMAYLAAEDYIEVMLGQHEAIEHVAYVIREHASNVELTMRASLALLNLTVCEPHVEELMERDSIPWVLNVLDLHANDVHVTIIVCGILANLSVLEDVRELLFQNNLFGRIATAMKLDPANSVLQVACIKAIVNFSIDAEYYGHMEQNEIPQLVEQALVNHPEDATLKKYGDYFFGFHPRCPIL